uniref:cAMP-dependent protein kinase regulatory subunit, putative n=1 Tax=Babesia bovis TaxID=5865 RepID=S6B3K7_BABBO|nr:cAMP-dependent protein kinase regulatory subunit, putative [Babesia bovis]
MFVDEDIIVEGDKGTSVFVILEGNGEAYCQGKLVKSYSEGGYFGEIAVIAQTPRASTVMDKGKCVVAELERETLCYFAGNQWRNASVTMSRSTKSYWQSST